MNEHSAEKLRYHSFGWFQGQTCIIEPLLQQRLKFAHVLKAQIQGLKARDGSLAEVVSIQLAHGQANVALMSERETYRRNYPTFSNTDRPDNNGICSILYRLV